MTPPARLGLAVLGAAVGLGLAGDLLLRAVPWGLNVFLCTLALVASGAWLLRRGAIRPGPDAPWLGLTALLLGAAFVRRDATLLGAFYLMALAATLALAAAAVRGVPIRRLGVAGYAAAGARTALDLVTGGPRLLAAHVPWREVTEGGRLARARGVGLGVLLAFPLLVVFGGLFMAADAVFDRMITTALRFDLGTVASHTFLFGLWATLAAGYLRGVALAPTARSPAAAPTTAGLGLTPVATALVLLNGLFLLFVAVQLRYLFGGAELVQRTLGLTYAEYARRGFLELVTASGLVLPVLLGADWTLRAAPPPQRRTLHRLAGVLLALLAVIVASGLERARLYVAAFGWSEIRLYATAGMVYFAGGFAWLAATVLRDRRQRFAFGAFVQGLTVLGALHVLNPDAFIVRRNLERPATARPFDAAYAVSLSGDAVPVLLDALPRLTPHDRCDVATALLHRWGDATGADWRTWNWGRARAHRLVAEHRPALASACDPATIPKETP
ncbi:MAG: DUF4153 domain-containing protein [Gemmatimonadales bacterium]